MRKPVTFLALLLLAACGGGEDSAPAMEEAPADAMEMAEPAGPSPADFAGTWTISNMLEGTPDPVISTMVVSEDGNDWTMSLPGRDDLTISVEMVGDSVVITTEPYESILQEGVMVTVRTANVLRDGMMYGNLVATYQTPDGERVVLGTSEGTRDGM